jgi:iron complex outermembrane receptor protein
MYGADLQTNAMITSRDSLNLSVSFLKTEFKDLIFDWYSEELEDEDWSGREMTFSPRWSISGNYKHDFEFPNGGILTARIDARYKTSYIISIVDFNMGVDFRGFAHQEAHLMGDLSAIYTDPDGKWSITGYVKNVTNYAEKRSLMGQSMSLSAPRTYGAVLSVNY